MESLYSKLDTGPGHSDRQLIQALLAGECIREGGGLDEST